MAVRPATPGDAAGIAAVRLAAWRHAYEEIVGARALEALDLDEETAHWRIWLAPITAAVPADASDATTNPQSDADAGALRTLVVEHAARVVGFVATLHHSREPDGPPDRGEVALLYVHPVAQGAGVGTTLLRAGEGAVRDAGRRSADLRVFAANWWARRFYAGRGWRRDDDAADPGDDPPTEHWVRDL